MRRQVQMKQKKLSQSCNKSHIRDITSIYSFHILDLKFYMLEKLHFVIFMLESWISYKGND